METDVKYDQSKHFAFGKNWADYSHTITEADIDSAKTELQKLLDLESLEGRTFLDIGCGSGIHSLCALKLGAESVHALDIDPDSVDTTRTVLAKYWDGDNFKVEQQNIFTADAARLSRHDIVYSWGVLHHTGDMWEAIDKAASLVDDGGRFAIAIYRKTPLCGFWKWEKKLFTDGGATTRRLLTWTFIGMKILRDLLRFKNPMKKIRRHSDKKRGMKWYTDVIDWLGGYPYESASPEEITQFMAQRDFTLVNSFKTGRRLGFFGTGNAEYLFVRNASAG
jgi:2-polyprenyl-6-hydroxyphenyl methylase/3-demethylubiquinone-9 3-methyltransferase